MVRLHPRTKKVQQAHELFISNLLICILYIIVQSFLTITHLSLNSMRNAVRENLRYFLFIFEIKADGDDEKRLEKLLEKAKVSIQSSLRSGDVFTRLNRYQFLVLLPCRLEDGAYRIAQRVSSSFS